MPEKSLQQRLVEEAKNFQELYNRFDEHHTARVNAGFPANPWLSAFDIPFEQSLENNGIEPDPSGQHISVIKAVRKLGLHKLRLGPIATSDSAISALIDLKAVDNRDAERLEAIFNKPGRNPVVKGLEPDRSDAIFWRTLLEIFCRTYTPQRGRPRRSSLSDSIHLVFDLDEILRIHLHGRWDDGKAIQKLKTLEPYKERYAGGPHHDGISMSRLHHIKSWVGPFDDGMLERASQNNPDAFWEVFQERNPSAARTDEEIKALVSTFKKPLLQLSDS